MYEWTVTVTDPNGVIKEYNVGFAETVTDALYKAMELREEEYLREERQ